jgi:hypothetical protein
VADDEAEEKIITYDGVQVMGLSLSWVATKTASPQEVLAAMELRPTGKKEDFPKSRLSAAQLSNGFYVVKFSRKELRQSKLKEFSRAFDLLYGFVEEHVMCSTVASWHNGKEIWSVAHDAQEGVMHLVEKGSLPTGLAAIRDRLFTEQKSRGQEDVDCIFDIPVELAAEITGYRYDQDIEGLGSYAFEVLEPVKQSMLERWNPFRKS